MGNKVSLIIMGRSQVAYLYSLLKDPQNKKTTLEGLIKDKSSIKTMSNLKYKTTYSTNSKLSVI